MRTSVLAALTVLFSLTPASPARAYATVNIGAPAPPPVLVGAPPLVVVAGTPVRYVPSASFNVFVYDGKSYSHHNGAWFVAARPRGPWTVLTLDRVPKPVLGVPVAYDKIPPGHARGKGAEGNKEER